MKLFNFKYSKNQFTIAVLLIEAVSATLRATKPGVGNLLTLPEVPFVLDLYLNLESGIC